MVKIDPYSKGVNLDLTGKKGMKTSIVLKPVKPPKRRDGSQYSGSENREDGYTSAG